MTYQTTTQTISRTPWFLPGVRKSNKIGGKEKWTDPNASANSINFDSKLNSDKKIESSNKWAKKYYDQYLAEGDLEQAKLLGLNLLYRQIFEYNGQPDTLNGRTRTYSPYFVYTVDSNCVLNKPLTIRYNQVHYVFAGFKYDESI